ncbi:MAG: bifunctional phosphoribosylaminoimidazolecarboxamide formyltransferase/IMP cyclohydrolase [Bdellovibrionales bacterium]|jgi:phosphoribosylaminoimidazolecarboxamide formyltransferase / IMP cyclohydrolase|nr:bifunctional phosphoribosylaminoimidazolecarboxamide formyltransferase/IMP cyclohydrolase [Bdellovibrionales bacterium]MBT3524744.1 bifunctional phosphoribosylaminoimidazolecarboxamide formyltransferase/IMP cyclohydrolase [Bdellovibrionales bacterium]MBT7767703.1 bifunctional phosphoribosylaminoimidazolecarboxamide formyltransferase/IMP cyclohydrolase [Bdellovibrionales bacterium]
MGYTPVKINRALISVTDKSHLGPLATVLHQRGVEIISTGGTGRFLQEAGIPYLPIEDVTGSPEAFAGRMKSISFQISSALLFRRSDPQDCQQAQELGIKPIDLVVCNLYPFAQVAKESADFSTLIENIDIGGPTMIRAAAKNLEAVTVLTDPSDYQEFITLLQQDDGTIDGESRQNFALKAFRLTAEYDTMIAATLNPTPLRYGENPHQRGWVVPNSVGRGLAGCKPIQGKALSYNNYLDADAALRSCADLASTNSNGHSVTIIKHSNPCGAAIAQKPLHALQNAWAGDPVSAFGSIIAISSEVNGEIAQWLSDKFVEVVLAPSFSADAQEIFARKKNLRLLAMPISYNQTKLVERTIDGGRVVQEEDSHFDHSLQSVTKIPYPTELTALGKFGIMVTKHLRSNAIALVFQNSQNEFSLAGAGMGNPNRLISHQQAFDKAKSNGHQDLSQMVLISDAFFPFADNIQIAHQAGVRQVIQPGGSIKDQEVIATCNQLEVAMAFTKSRHFRH